MPRGSVYFVTCRVSGVLIVAVDFNPRKSCKICSASRQRRFEIFLLNIWQIHGVFTVSKSQKASVVEYIKNQRDHHAKQTFEEEFVELLKLHEIEYDEKYLFG